MANCADCEKSVSWMSLRGRRCAECYALHVNNEDAAKAPANREQAHAAAAHIVLTTETAHNLPVTERLGIVAAEVVIGMHIFRDIGAAFRDVFGGRSQTMQKGLKDAREAALSELRAEAAQLGADAVVGIDLDYSEISGGGKSMLFLVASGTAVRLS